MTKKKLLAMPKQLFEEQMAKLMQGFTAEPETFVWQNVEKAIAEKKRRRRFIFWWILPVAILAGIGFYTYNSILNTSTHNIKTSININKDDTASSNNKIIDIKRENVKNNSIQIAVAKRNNQYTVSSKANDHANIIRKKNKKTVITAGSSIIKVNNQLVAKQKDQGAHNNVINNTATITQNKKEAFITDSVKSKKDSIAITKKPVTDSLINLVNTKPQQKSIQNNKWNFGITASAGIVKEQMTDANSLSLNQYAPSGTASPISGVPSLLYYKNKAGIAFTAGVFAEKKLSNKLSIETGLNYNLYNTKQNIAVTSAVTGGFAVNKFTQSNKYHALLIPVIIKGNIYTKNKSSLQLFGGLNNFLFLSAKASIKNENDQTTENKSLLPQLNKYQLSAQYGLSFKFTISGSAFSISPLFQHSLTNLSASANHKWFNGMLKLNYYFKK